MVDGIISKVLVLLLNIALLLKNGNQLMDLTWKDIQYGIIVV